MKPVPSRLQCPYLECEETIAVADAAQELVACAGCRRPSARCPRHGPQGRCPALNRPLARFCRYCGEEFQPDWAHAAWESDLARAAGMQVDFVRDPDPSTGRPADAHRDVVLALDEYLLPGGVRGRPAELTAAGSWLWIGLPEGRFLVVDPFRDGAPPLVIEQVWPGQAPMRLRARAGGPWLLVWCDRGIQVVNLLALDDNDPHRDDHRAAKLWEPTEGSRLISDPVLLRLQRNSPNRLAAWVVTGAGGPMLCLAYLRMDASHLPGVRQWPLSQHLPDLAVEGPDLERVALVEASFGEGDSLLLGARRSLHLIALVLKEHTLQVTGQPLLQGKVCRTEAPDLPGVVFLPGTAPAPGQSPDGVFGRAVIACQEAGTSEPSLMVLTVSAGPERPIAFAIPEAGLPVAAVPSAGPGQVLSLAGSHLQLFNLIPQRTPVCDHLCLRGARRGSVYGRVAVCTGLETAGNRWFTLLADVRNGRLIDLAVHDVPPVHPVMLGRFLFAVEPVAAGLCLTRRRFH